MDRRSSAGGQRRLESLRQKRNALRSRSDEAKLWAGAGSTSGVAPSDAAVLAAAARRRQQHAYALSSTSSSDGEEGPAADSPPAPTPQELTARLFAKLGIKGGGKMAAGVGCDSDSSWASSLERGARIRARQAGSRDDAVPTGSVDAVERLQGELAQAQGTILALTRELAAARAQADGATEQLRGSQVYALQLEARLDAAEEAAAGADRGLPTAGSTDAAAQQLSTANWALQQQVAGLEAQLESAAAWQGEVHAMQEQLGGMQAAVAESEAARQAQQEQLAGQLGQRELELLAATAGLAAAEAQLAALHGGGGAAAELRSSSELLAHLGVSQAQLMAALAEAASLLA